MASSVSIARSARDLPDKLHGTVIAIGNFDGVHRGHRAVLDKALDLAHNNSLAAMALTFEPHPRTLFAPDKPVFRLTPAAMKAELLGVIGFDWVFEQAFDRDFAGRSADEFLTEFLRNTLRARHVVTGYDFHFGKARQGTPQYLQSAGAGLGFETTLVDAFSDENGEVISSSRIRDALSTGDISQANALLGYAFRIRGTVQSGKQLGRTLGFPTANIALPAYATLAHGIYAVRVERANGDMHDGVASFGRRPTFDNGEALFETFLLDFNEDLYGEELTIYCHAWLRGEEKFDSAEALVKQMKQDEEEARQFLMTLAPSHGKFPIGSRDASLEQT